jgi:hypothetical protein
MTTATINAVARYLASVLEADIAKNETNRENE